MTTTPAPRADLAAWRDLSASIVTALEAVDGDAGQAFVEAVATYAAPLVDEGAIDEAITRIVAAHSAETTRRDFALPIRRRRLAIHEAGHAVTATVLGIVVTQATIEPDLVQGYNGAVYLNWATAETVEAWEGCAVVAFAGDVAVRMDGHAFEAEGCAVDFANAAKAARRSRAGLSEPEERALLVYARTRATEIVRRHWRAVDAVALALLKETTLTGDAVRSTVAAAMPSPIAEVV